MLSKGTELFMFEGDFFRFKARWINNGQLSQEEWKTLLIELQSLIDKYSGINDTIQEYIEGEGTEFIRFLRRKNV